MIEVIDLEKELIGSFILDDSSRKYIEFLSEDDFMDEINRHVFKTIAELAGSNKELETFEISHKAGVSVLQISEFTDYVTTTANTKYKVKRLKDYSNRRALMRKAEELKKMCLDEEIEVEDIKARAISAIESGVTTISENDGVVTLKEAMIETIGELERRAENKDDKSLYTNITKLDVATAGLHKEELTVIAARPGRGKTVLGMQIAQQIAKNKKKVMFTSLEMSSLQLCERIITAQSDTNSNKLRKGEIKDDEWVDIMKAANRNAIENFMIDKTSRKPSHIRRKIKKYKPDLVVIDYLQLLEADEKMSARHLEIGSITRTIKLMTLEFKIPIIMLSQLTRNAEGQRPKMSDLRESGSIEQDSDNILFIHGPEDYELSKLIDDGIITADFVNSMIESENKITELILEKQRNGPTGSFLMVFNPRLMKFVGV